MTEIGAGKRASKKKSKRKSPNGGATNVLIHSCYQGTNDALFSHVLSLYVAKGSTVADVNFGKGFFWRVVPRNEYQVMATNLAHGTDYLKLPYIYASINCDVFK